MMDAIKPGQRAITDYFNFEKICNTIEENVGIRARMNDTCGRPSESNVAPLLQRIYENAQKNVSSSKHGNGHDIW